MHMKFHGQLLQRQVQALPRFQPALSLDVCTTPLHWTRHLLAPDLCVWQRHGNSFRACGKDPLTHALQGPVGQLHCAGCDRVRHALGQAFLRQSQAHGPSAPTRQPAQALFRQCHGDRFRQLTRGLLKFRHPQGHSVRPAPPSAAHGLGYGGKSHLGGGLQGVHRIQGRLVIRATMK